MDKGQKFLSVIGLIAVAAMVFPLAGFAATESDTATAKTASAVTTAVKTVTKEAEAAATKTAQNIQKILLSRENAAVSTETPPVIVTSEIVDPGTPVSVNKAVAKAAVKTSVSLVGKEGSRTLPGGQVVSNKAAPEAAPQAKEAVPAKQELSSKEEPQVEMEGEIPVIKTREKVKGEVTQIEMSAITVLYQRTETAEYEKQIPLDAKVKLSGFKSLKDLALNDEVEIDYEKKVEYPKQPNEKRFMTAKSITLVKKYKPEEEKKV